MNFQELLKKSVLDTLRKAELQLHKASILMEKLERMELLSTKVRNTRNGHGKDDRPKELGQQSKGLQFHCNFWQRLERIVPVREEHGGVQLELRRRLSRLQQ